MTAGIYYQRALKLLPTYFSLYVNLGILKAATGHDELAETYFKKGQWFGSNYPDAYIYYARFLNSRGRYNEAITNLQTALKLSPANIYARLLLMDAYENTENWTELNNWAKSSLQLEPNHPEIKNYLQAAISKKSKIDAEADQIKQAPTAEKYLALSLLYYNAGRFMQCIDACEKAIGLKPDFPEAYNNICAAYNKLQQWDSAIAAAKKGLAISPDNQLLKNNLQEAYNHIKQAAR
nr:tetratricopeptide repeat protein [Mucilaginibacter sp. UR6-11]